MITVVSMKLFSVSIFLKVLMDGLGTEDGLSMVVLCPVILNKITFVRDQLDV